MTRRRFVAKLEFAAGGNTICGDLKGCPGTALIEIHAIHAMDAVGQLWQASLKRGDSDKVVSISISEE